MINKEKNMSILQLEKYALTIILTLGPLLGCGPKTNELAGTSWELVSLNGKELIEGTTITLEFSETYLGGEMSCNGYGGSSDGGKYIKKNNGTFQLGDPFAVTVQLCTEPEGIMEQEAAYIEALMDATHFRLVENRLEIMNVDEGVALIYHRR
jgi:heat shock protein HslJ